MKVGSSRRHWTVCLLQHRCRSLRSGLPKISSVFFLQRFLPPLPRRLASCTGKQGSQIAQAHVWSSVTQTASHHGEHRKHAIHLRPNYLSSRNLPHIDKPSHRSANVAQQICVLSHFLLHFRSVTVYLNNWSVQVISFALNLPSSPKQCRAGCQKSAPSAGGGRIV